MKYMLSLFVVSLILSACSENPSSNEDPTGQESSSLSSSFLGSSGAQNSSTKLSSSDSGNSSSFSSGESPLSSSPMHAESSSSSLTKNSSSSKDSSPDIVRQTQKASMGRYGTFTDARDSKSYHWTEIGAQVWMADNIDFEAATDAGECFEYNSLACPLFGRMYDYSQAQSACPTGWHLPSDIEYRVLLKSVGVPQAWFDSVYISVNNGPDSIMNIYQYGNTYAAPLFTTNPILGSGLGTDSYHFRLMPAGYADESSYPWGFFTSTTHLWTSTKATNDTSIAWSFNNNASDWPSVKRTKKISSTLGYVRCLYNGKATALTEAPVPTPDPLFTLRTLPVTTATCTRTPTNDEFCDTRDGQVYAKKTLGTHVWMAQNLAYSGDGTLGVCPEGTAAGCEKYGRLYPNHIAMNRPVGCNYTECRNSFPIQEGICPTGWRIPTELEAQTDILPIDTTLLEASSLKNQFAGSISKNAGYDKGDLKQEFLGYRLRFWLTPKNEYDSDAPILEVLDNKTTPARIISSPLRKYFSMSVRCVEE